MTTRPTTTTRALRVGLVGLALVAVGFVPASGAPADEPLTAPVPRPTYIDDQFSFLVDLDYSAPDTASVAGVQVVRGATAPTHMLKRDNTAVVSGDGGNLSTATLPDPSESRAHGAGFFFQPGRERITVPYSAKATQLTLSDLVPARVVAAADLTGAVADFCTSNPAEPSCRRDLRSGISDAPDPAVAGGPLTYRVVLANDGPSPAFRAAVTVDIPTGIAVATPPAGCANQPDGDVVCRAERIAAGAETNFVLVAAVPSGFLNGRGPSLTVTATATATSPVGTEADTSDDTASTSTLVEAVSDLAVTKTADRLFGTAGDIVTYAIGITNSGPSDADGLLVTDDLPKPAEGQLMSATASDQGTCLRPPTGQLRCTWPAPVPPGASRKATVRVAVTDDGVEDRITDTATARAVGRDPNPTNDRATVVTAVVKAATTTTPNPALARALPGLWITVGELSSRLTRADTGRPVVGRTVTFRAGKSIVCTARTDATGLARCDRLSLLQSLSVALNLGFTATFDGDGRYVASQGSGPLVVVGR